MYHKVVSGDPRLPADLVDLSVDRAGDGGPLSGALSRRQNLLTIDLAGILHSSWSRRVPDIHDLSDRHMRVRIRNGSIGYAGFRDPIIRSA